MTEQRIPESRNGQDLDDLIANVVNAARQAGFARGRKLPDDSYNRDEDAAVHALRMAVSETQLAIQELENIVNANRYDRKVFEDDEEFADWAISRCNFTLWKLGK